MSETASTSPVAVAERLREAAAIAQAAYERGDVHAWVYRPQDLRYFAEYLEAHPESSTAIAIARALSTPSAGDSQ